MPGFMPTLYLLAGMHGLLALLTWGFSGLIEQAAADNLIASTAFLPQDIYNLFNAPFVNEGVDSKGFGMFKYVIGPLMCKNSQLFGGIFELASVDYSLLEIAKVKNEQFGPLIALAPRAIALGAVARVSWLGLSWVRDTGVFTSPLALGLVFSLGLVSTAQALIFQIDTGQINSAVGCP